MKAAPCLRMPNKLATPRTRPPKSIKTAQPFKSPVNWREGGGNRLVCPDKERRAKVTPKVAGGVTRQIHAAMLKNEDWRFAGMTMDSLMMLNDPSSATRHAG